MAYIFLCEKENVNEKKASISESILWVLILFSQIIHSLKWGILGREYIRYSLLFIPTTCLLIFFFATEKGIAVKLCTNKFLVCLGDLSSHAFLIHFVVIRYVQTIYEILGGGQKWIPAIVSFGLTVVLSWLVKELEKKYRWLK